MTTPSEKPPAHFRLPEHGVAREVSLAGSAAVTWLRKHGWRADPSSRHFQVFGDLLRADPFAIGRIWHTAGSLQLFNNEDWHPDVFIAILGIEGSQTLETAQGPVELGPGQLYVQPLSRQLTIRSSAPSARLVLVSEWSRMRIPRLPRNKLEGAFDAESGYVAVFVDAANTALSMIPATDSPAFALARRGIEHLFTGALLGDTAAREQRAPEGLLMHRALALIAADYADTALSVAVLANRLNTSTSSLSRAFAVAGTTPLSAIRAARVTAARALLQQQDDPRTPQLQLIAAATGFGSVRALQRALVSGVARD